MRHPKIGTAAEFHILLISQQISRYTCLHKKKKKKKPTSWAAFEWCKCWVETTDYLKPEQDLN